MGTLGDTMGMVNSFFSALAFAGVIYSILQQNKTIRSQRREFKAQIKTQYLDRFEATFFRLFDIHTSTKEHITAVAHYHERVVLKGDNAIREHYSTFRSGLITSPDWSSVHDALYTFLDLNLIFYGFLDNIDAMHLFIVKHKHLTYEQKEFYLKIITRAASYEELALYFYYQAAIRGDTYSGDGPDIFNQLEPKYMVDASHLSYYYSHPSRSS
jgi:hypothetical protein